MKNIIVLLNTGNFYGVSKEIDIAKGIYAIPYNWKAGFIQMKRIWKSKK
jgi:hypothetical protein